MKPTPKLRPSTRVDGEGETPRKAFIIEICFHDRWLPLGDSKHRFSFNTAEERDEAMGKVLSKLAEEALDANTTDA